MGKAEQSESKAKAAEDAKTPSSCTRAGDNHGPMSLIRPYKADGAFLGPSWPILRSFGSLFGPSWGHLGPCKGILGHLGAILEPSWAILGHLGAILGPSWAILGPSWPSWGHPGAILGQLGPTRPRNPSKKVLFPTETELLCENGDALHEKSLDPKFDHSLTLFTVFNPKEHCS
mgnify:CR=1 FL=1